MDINRHEIKKTPAMVLRSMAETREYANFSDLELDIFINGMAERLFWAESVEWKDVRGE